MCALACRLPPDQQAGSLGLQHGRGRHPISSARNGGRSAIQGWRRNRSTHQSSSRSTHTQRTSTMKQLRQPRTTGTARGAGPHSSPHQLCLHTTAVCSCVCIPRRRSDDHCAGARRRPSGAPVRVAGHQRAFERLGADLQHIQPLRTTVVCLASLESHPRPV